MSKLNKSFIPAIIGSLILPASGVIIGVFLNFIKQENLAYVASIVISTVFLNSLLLILFGRSLVMEDFKQDMNLLIARGNRLINGKDDQTLVCNKETEIYEGSASRVWVFTSDFYWDLRSLDYKDNVVYRNIKAGKEYRYLFPMSYKKTAEKCKQNIEENTKINIKTSKKVKFTPIDDKYFNILLHEIIILDADSESAKVLLIDINRKRLNEANNSLDLLLTEKDVVRDYVMLFKKLEEKSVDI